MEPKQLVKKMKKHLCLPGLLKSTRRSFELIQDSVKRTAEISLPDVLMSGLAMLGLKYPSLLQFDIATRSDEMVKHNLSALYSIQQAPSDTQMRERLDLILPQHLQKTINKTIALLQRAKVLEQYRYFKDYCLVPIDGTGYFSSNNIYCESCCQKNHKDGTVTYQHQMLTAVIAHPNYKTVFPLMLEPITKQDGITKNDCEHNAAKRLLRSLRNYHPHLKMIILLDALYADSAIIRLLQKLELPFIITAKEKDLSYLFDAYKNAKKEEVCYVREGINFNYKFCNNLPLNDSNQEIKVNLFQVLISNQPKEQYFCWITDLPLDKNDIEELTKSGRCRWRIENETFNTLKNQGYQFEHNFGHGYKYLSTVLAYLMFQAFLIDQIQEFCCKYFKAALEKAQSKLRLWEKIRGLFIHYFVDSWEQIYTVIIDNLRGLHLSELINTS